MNWAIGIYMYTMMCIKLMTNKNLLYKKINKIQKQILRKSMFKPYFVPISSYILVFWMEKLETRRESDFSNFLNDF